MHDVPSWRPRRNSQTNARWRSESLMHHRAINPLAGEREFCKRLRIDCFQAFARHFVQRHQNPHDECRHLFRGGPCPDLPRRVFSDVLSLKDPDHLHRAKATTVASRKVTFLDSPFRTRILEGAEDVIPLLIEHGCGSAVDPECVTAQFNSRVTQRHTEGAPELVKPLDCQHHGVDCALIAKVVDRRNPSNFGAIVCSPRACTQGKNSVFDRLLKCSNRVFLSEPH
jgi:hypothetical protein